MRAASLCFDFVSPKQEKKDKRAKKQRHGRDSGCRSPFRCGVRRMRRTCIVVKRTLVGSFHCCFFNSVSMSEGRRVGAGREYLAVAIREIWSQEGVYQKLPWKEGLTLGGSKGTSPPRLDGGITVFTSM